MIEAKLRYGSQGSSSLADWYLDEQCRAAAIRLPWDLVNVTDPSTHTLLDDRRTTGRFGTTRAAGFHIGVIVHRTRGGEIVGALPRLEDGTWRETSFLPWRWRGWSTPRAHGRLKPVYDSLKLLWREAPAGAPARPGRRAPSN